MMMAVPYLYRQQNGDLQVDQTISSMTSKMRIIVEAVANVLLENMTGESGGHMYVHTCTARGASSYKQLRGTTN